MTPVDPFPAEWLPVSTAPDEGDLEICVMAYDGIVRGLDYPCHRQGAEWVDGSNNKLIDMQPTHWRKWSRPH